MRNLFPVILSLFLVVGVCVTTITGVAAQTSTPAAAATCSDENLAAGTADARCVRYLAISQGMDDGFIILSNSGVGIDLAVYCAKGQIAFTDQVEVNGNQTFVLATVATSCDFKSLSAIYLGSDKVVRSDPTTGWTFVTELDAAQDVIKQCHGSALISLRARTDGLPEYKIDAGLPECAGNPVG